MVWESFKITVGNGMLGAILGPSVLGGVERCGCHFRSSEIRSHFRSSDWWNLLGAIFCSRRGSFLLLLLSQLLPFRLVLDACEYASPLLSVEE